MNYIDFLTQFYSVIYVQAINLCGIHSTRCRKHSSEILPLTELFLFFFKP